MTDKIILGGDENTVAAAGDEADQTLGAALIKLNLAGGQRRHHHPVSLDVSHFQVEAVLCKQTLFETDPQRREAAADGRIADVDGGEFFILRREERGKTKKKS